MIRTWLGPHDFDETGLCDKITSYELTFQESGEYKIYIHGGEEGEEEEDEEE